MTLVQRLIGDGIVAAGMIGALNADFLADNLEKGYDYILKKKVSKNTNLAQHVKRVGGDKKAEITNMILKYVLMAGFAYNILYNQLAPEEQRRSSIINVLYFFYPLITWTSTLPEILLDDFSSLWPLRDKQRYILFPVNLFDNKVLGKPIYGDQKITQVYSAHKKMSETSVFGLLAGLILLAKFAPPGVFIFWSWLPFIFHENLNTNINAIADYMTLTEIDNKYEHLFGTFSSVFKGPESDDKLGIQYELFTRSYTPAQSFFKKKVFNELRSKKFSVRESLASTYLAKGIFFAGLLYTLKLQNLAGTIGMLAYYGYHAGFRMLNIEPRFMESSPFFRYIWFIAELILSGFLFYKPALDTCVRTLHPATAGVLIVSGLLLEYYNKGDQLETKVRAVVSKAKSLLGPSKGDK